MRNRPINELALIKGGFNPPRFETGLELNSIWIRFMGNSANASKFTANGFIAIASADPWNEPINDC